MRPYDANTITKVCKMQSDNKTAGDFWILSDNHSMEGTAAISDSALDALRAANPTLGL